jgi:hypothetical protein
VFESFERENGSVIVFPSSVVGSDNAGEVSGNWRDQKKSDFGPHKVGTSLLSYQKPSMHRAAVYTCSTAVHYIIMSV